MDQLGTPALLIATEVFVTLAEHEAAAFNVPSFPLVTVPHPLASLPTDRIAEIGASLADEVQRILTDNTGAAA